MDNILVDASLKPARRHVWIQVAGGAITALVFGGALVAARAWWGKPGGVENNFPFRPADLTMIGFEIILTPCVVGVFVFLRGLRDLLLLSLVARLAHREKMADGTTVDKLLALLAGFARWAFWASWVVCLFVVVYLVVGTLGVMVSGWPTQGY